MLRVLREVDFRISPKYNIKRKTQTMFILSGILIFSDKIIDKKTAVEE